MNCTDLETNNHAIRFGVMCNGFALANWQAICIQKILEIQNTKLALIILNKEFINPLSTGGKCKLFFRSNFYEKLKLFGKWYRNRFYLKNRLWNEYWRLFVCRNSAALKPMDMTNQFENIPHIYCSAIYQDKYSQYFSQKDTEEIKRYDLDFILRFGFGILRGKILCAAAFGIWSFHHGDEEKYRGSPACFWEFFNGDDINGAILQRITDRLDSGIILHKGFFDTKENYVKTLDHVCFGSSDWPARVCKEVRCGNYTSIQSDPSETVAPIYLIPTNRQMISFIVKESFRYFDERIKYLVFDSKEQWNVGIVDVPIHSFLYSRYKPHINWIPESSLDRFVADPFAAVQFTNNLKIIVEEYDWETGQGRISVIQQKVDKSFADPIPIIDLPVHLSYPYIFEYNGKIYCVPETYQANEISLYEAINFPHNWKKVATLIENFPGVDPTVFCYNKYWWLFATIREYSNTKLYAWYAENPLGKWNEHYLNPLKTDIRSSRPAGTPFIYKKQLYRPAQDSSISIGGRVALNRVLRLTKKEFKEEYIGFIEPDVKGNYPDGLHTLSAVGNITLIDGLKIIRRKRKVQDIVNILYNVLKYKLRSYN